MYKLGIPSAVIGFTLCHVLLCIERSMAVLRPERYETTGVIFGFVSTALSWLIIFFWMLYMFIGEDLTQQLAYCNLTTPTNSYKWTIEYFALMVVDIIVLVADIVITIVNKKSLRTYLVRASYTQKFLGHAYQLNENAKAMSIILPLSIAHSIVFLLFLSTTILIRIIFQHLDPVTFRGLIECANTFVCLYTVVIPLVYFRLRKNLMPKKTQIVPKGVTETEMYFRVLNASINVHK